MLISFISGRKSNFHATLKTGVLYFYPLFLFFALLLGGFIGLNLITSHLPGLLQFIFEIFIVLSYALLARSGFQIYLNRLQTPK